jgi:hypothetical protein
MGRRPIRTWANTAITRPMPSATRAAAVVAAKRRASSSIGVRSSAAMNTTGNGKPDNLAETAVARSGSSRGPRMS